MGIYQQETKDWRLGHKNGVCPVNATSVKGREK